MGNKLARTTQVSASEYYLHDLPSSYNLVLKEALGGGRLLKSVQCVHDEGLLLVKVYFKRGESLDLKVLSLSTWMGSFACRLTHRNAKPSRAFVNWKMSSYYDFCWYVSWSCIIARCFPIYYLTSLGPEQEYEKKLHEIRDQLKDIEHSHVWPFQVRSLFQPLIVPISLF